MSFYWDGWYAVILYRREAPAGHWACAEGPYSERTPAEDMEQFDSVEYISKQEYDVTDSGQSKPRTYAPDAKQYEGVVHKLVAKAEPYTEYLETSRRV